MIEVLTDFPDNVLAVRASGTVTKSDYERVLIPAAKAALEEHRKLRVYYEIAPGLNGFEPGAMWDDFALGMGHFSRWEQVAVVTDIDWIKRAIHAFAFLLPCPVKVYSPGEAQVAKAWIIS